MKQEINLNQFIDEFKNTDKDYYSYEGYKALYDYYNEFEDFNLDVIGVCCDVSEYTQEEILKEYSYLLDKDDYDKDDYDILYFDDLIQELHNHTTLINLENDSFLIWGF